MYVPVKEKKKISCMKFQLFIKNKPLFIAVLLISAFIHLTSCDNAKNPDRKTIKESDSLAYRAKLADNLNLLYNYTKNNEPYQLTFLGFGSVGCIECKKMEKVLAEVRNKYKNRINVVFYNARIKENRKMFDHFGIKLIPVQILLDKNGKECFRHTGFYSFDQLNIEFNKLVKF
jgi:thiol-disulfide isomerase/thioredoxin